MVQLSLPKGSKPSTGKVHKAPAGAKNVKTYKVYRYDPEVDADPRGELADGADTLVVGLEELESGAVQLRAECGSGRRH